MIMEIRNTDNGIRQLVLNKIRLSDEEFLSAWLYALGMTDEERKHIYIYVLKKGSVSFSNIKYKLTVYCHKN